MPEEHYFTVEFVCSSREQVRQLCTDITNKYRPPNAKDGEVKMSAWRDGPMGDEGE